MTLRTRTAKIDRHVGALAEMFGMPNEVAMRAYKRLQHVESYANEMAIQDCNFANVNWDKVRENVVGKIERILGKVPERFHINTDPRGYALKLEPGMFPRGFYTDMGGYGILAPTFSSEE